MHDVAISSLGHVGTLGVLRFHVPWGSRQMSFPRDSGIRAAASFDSRVSGVAGFRFQGDVREDVPFLISHDLTTKGCRFRKVL